MHYTTMVIYFPTSYEARITGKEEIKHKAWQNQLWKMFYNINFGKWLWKFIVAIMLYVQMFNGYKKENESGNYYFKMVCENVQFNVKT